MPSQGGGLEPEAPHNGTRGKWQPDATAPSYPPSSSEATGLVAPRPIYARPLPLLRPSSDSSDRSPQLKSLSSFAEQDNRHATPVLDEEGEERGRQDVDGKEQAAMTSTRDYASILPVKGIDGEADLAREKLERMKRAKESKRRWKVRTGAQGLVLALTAGGKSRRRTEHEIGQQQGEMLVICKADETSQAYALFIPLCSR